MHAYLIFLKNVNKDCVWAPENIYALDPHGTGQFPVLTHLPNPTQFYFLPVFSDLSPTPLEFPVTSCKVDVQVDVSTLQR